MKKFNPYQSLKKSAQEFAQKVNSYLKCGTVMFTWTRDSLMTHPPTGFRLDDVYQRALAAQQLGYDVILVADQTAGMTLYYKKKLPATIPYELI
jgi:hypothetical protein